MSVYTSVSDQEMIVFLQQYELGEFIALKGIAGGITNTNYFVDTTHGRFVLTLFETLQLDELPFFLHLKDYLNRQGIACPAPISLKNGQLCSMLANKPAAIITCLNGADVSDPNAKQCYSTGAMLAKMHLAGAHFDMSMDNPRYRKWWEKSATNLADKLAKDQHDLLENEIDFLNKHPLEQLPSGIIHADLFKDNVLMYGDDVAGFIDFYYACNGPFIYDLAIALNDWTRNKEGRLDDVLYQAFLDGYNDVRPLNSVEKDHLIIAHRAACVRFWVSRLLDYHFPVAGEITFIKNPDDFKLLLLHFRNIDKTHQ